MGVDVFFVLSGFLITSILLNRREEPNPLKDFYANRARRILPPYLLCLAFSAIFCFVDWREVWPYYALPLENLASIFHSSHIGPLGPLWSLAIEEQFYLIWPLLVLTRSRKTLVKISVAIVVLTPIVRLLVTPFFPSHWIIYELTPFRLDTISSGALIALLYQKNDWRLWLEKFATLSAFAAVTLLVVASQFGFYLESNSRLFNSLGFSTVALMSAGLLVWAIKSRGWLYAILTARPLRYIGRISYMAYLIHLPMIRQYKILVLHMATFTAANLRLFPFHLRSCLRLRHNIW